ncbi:YhcN/YlaJ family sporulation lipoprotein [Mangrovibacillus cuniculi]|nr:YhcN/YlaJ family sporulation lipoprotein [Mangrovibacillus cuniculi]
MKKLMIISIISCFMIMGCQKSAAEKEQQATGDDVPRTVNVKNSTIEHVDRKTGMQISKHLVNLATATPNVKDATAVVLGKLAIVGIDVDQNLERSEVGSIKYTVAEALQNDPYGANALVVADPDVYGRLKEINQDIRAGKPLQGIANELADVAGRLIPEIPADIIDPNPQQVKEDKRDAVEGQDKDSLKKQQEDQSNQYLQKKD